MKEYKVRFKRYKGYYKLPRLSIYEKRVIPNSNNKEGWFEIAYSVYEPDTRWWRCKTLRKKGSRIDWTDSKDWHEPNEEKAFLAMITILVDKGEGDHLFDLEMPEFEDVGS